MTYAIPVSRFGGATMLYQMGCAFMDVILHVGAHRTGTTSFQHFMYAQTGILEAEGVEFWGPKQTRKSVFPGLFRTAGLLQGRHVGRRAEGRIKMMTGQLENKGVQALLISDENMIGTCVQNFRSRILYPGIGERMARVAAAFDGRIGRVVLCLRAQDLWWASAAAMTVARGHPIPSRATCRTIAAQSRSWRDVITDLACAVPDTDIQVVPFEQNAGQPQNLLRAALGRDLPVPSGREWHNRSANLVNLREIVTVNGADSTALPRGDGRWLPFTPTECATLRENYADDLHWLTAGADGLATLTENTNRSRADISLPPVQNTKGPDYDQGYPDPQGQLAEHRGR